MVLTSDEVSVLIRYYEDLMGYIDRRIDNIKNSDADLLLDSDIIEKQINRLMDDRKLYEHRLEKFKSVSAL